MKNSKVVKKQYLVVAEVSKKMKKPNGLVARNVVK